MNQQSEVQTEMVRKLRADKASVEQDLAAFKASEKKQIYSNTKHLEQTCEDLTRELNNAHGEIADKDQSIKIMEGELVRLNNMVHEVNSTKVMQQRKIENLNGELRLI